jgi:hypothetical protein
MIRRWKHKRKCRRIREGKARADLLIYPDEADAALKRAGVKLVINTHLILRGRRERVR